MDDQWIKTRNKMRWNEPFSWIRCAQELYSTANLLLEINRENIDVKIRSGKEPDVNSPPRSYHFLMIFGFAFESLLKGIWLKKGNQFVNTGVN